MGGRPAAAASSAVAAGAPASSGSAARRGPPPVGSDSVSESSSGEDPEDPEVQRMVLESFSHQAAPTEGGSSGSLDLAFGALDASLGSTTSWRSEREDPKRRETAKAFAKAVAEVAAEARTRDRGGGRKKQRPRSNRGPFRHVPARIMKKALSCPYEWDEAVSRALTNLLRHDHHAEVTAQGFMDTAGWVSVKDIATVPSIRAWALEETDIRNIVLHQGKKERLEFNCWEDKIRCIQGHGATVGSSVHFEEIFMRVSFDAVSYTHLRAHET